MSSMSLEALEMPDAIGLRQLRHAQEIADTLAVAGPRLETSPALWEVTRETLLRPYADPARDPIHPETAMAVCRAFLGLVQQANADLHSQREVGRAS